jgi:V8-like Glu-specific endopeptidase
MWPSNHRFGHALERLESPFLDEESRREDTWHAAEDAESVSEIEYETPPQPPSKPIDFLGGRLWSFTAKTLPMRVGVFCPSAMTPAKPIDMLLFAHGDLGGCAPSPKVMPDDLITKAPFELGKIVEASKRQIALVVPSMDWENLTRNKLKFQACNMNSYSMHALGIPENLNGVLKEALAEIARVFATAVPSVDKLILAGHSRAHAFLNPLALLHVDPQMWKGVLASLKEVWCLDTTYHAFMAEWTRWLKANVNLRVSVFYQKGSGTAAYGRRFAAVVPTLGGGKLIVTPATEGHCKIPSKRLPLLLNPSTTSVTPEITEEIDAEGEADRYADEWSDEAPAADEEFDRLGAEAAEESTDAEESEDAGESEGTEELEAVEELEGAEEEVIGNDDRAMVADTLKVPNRWICAIDILTENPKWGNYGQPQLLTKSRATGILIGPRHVLTAAHVLGNLGRNAAGPVKGLIISPARNGSNSNNPFGKVTFKSVHVSRPYQVRRRVRQGGRVIDIPIQQRDDYALIVLDKDLASSTHSKLKGVLGYWGQDTAVAALRRLEPADINGKSVAVIGYPGDTCGKDKWSGSKSSKEKQIADCWNRRNDEWASTQWRSLGTLDVDRASTTIFHTADTYEGQSGSPICISVDRTLHLAGIHTASDTPHRNQGVRVTRRMLRELCAWINADAGTTIASIQNDTLVLQPAGGAAVARELFEQEDADQEDADQEDADQEDADQEDADLRDAEREDDEEFVAVESEEDEDAFSRELPVEERFDPASVPANVAAARDKQDWPLTLKLAIEAGIRTETDLTNILFFARHPELPPEPVKKEHPNFKALSAEWKKILLKEVKPAIARAVENTSLKVAAKYVLERDPMFAGDMGRKFKALVEETARDADINPGLLAAVLLAEWDKRSLYLSPGQVVSFVSGTDDFYAMRAQLEANVPAFSKVRFDARRRTTNTNEHGRIVTTVAFKTGKDAMLATAVYLKYAEIKLRKAAAKNGGDFDTFPVETRFALVRVAMAAGHGGITPDGEFIWFKKTGNKWAVVKKGTPGAKLRGVAPRLELVLKGGDFLVRKHEERKDPTNSAHITNRNATILAAQALHLSDWIFGIPLHAGVQPELEWLESAEDETELPDFEAERVTDEDLVAESF